MRALGLALRAVLCWMLLSFVAIFYGREVTAWMLPAIEQVGELIRPGFHWGLTLEDHDQALMISLRATAQMPIPAGPNSGINAGAVVKAGSTVAHILLPAVVWFCVLVAWPVRTSTERLGLLLTGLIGSQVFSILTCALLLAAKIEMALQNVAYQANERRTNTLLTDLMVFIETGGNIVIALVGAALCIASVLEHHRWKRPATPETAPADRLESEHPGASV